MSRLSTLSNITISSDEEENNDTEINCVPPVIEIKEYDAISIES